MIDPTAPDLLITVQQLAELHAAADNTSMIAARMGDGFESASSYASGVADTFAWLAGDLPTAILADTLDLHPGTPVQRIISSTIPEAHRD